MAIEKKLIHFGKLVDFEAQLTAGNILDYSIVFIQDAKKIWTHGTYYDCSESVSPDADNVYITDFTVNDLDNAIVSESDVVADLTSLELALAAHKVVLVPYDAGLGYLGYGILVGYAEDLLYFSVYSGGNGSVFYEIEETKNDTYIRYQSVRKRAWDEKQDRLYSGTNIKTINGESILGSGDLTIESGAKIYEWFYDGESKYVLLSQEEYDNIVEADIVVVNLGGIYSFAVSKSGKEFSEAMGKYALIGQLESEGIKLYIDINIDIPTKVATITAGEKEILTKTSQLENDSNFVSSDNLKTINGESIVGSGDITISGGGVNVQSDWNENDPSSNTYVNGRTHYSYDLEEEAWFSTESKNEGDVLVTGLYDNAFYRIYNHDLGRSGTFHFVEGRKVPIPSVGPPIEAVCTYEDDYCLKFTTPNYGLHYTCSLTLIYVEQLKDIYIPETIARKDDVTTITTDDIDLIWNSYFSEDGYGSASATALDDVINSIGVGDYDETEE